MDGSGVTNERRPGACRAIGASGSSDPSRPPSFRSALALSENAMLYLLQKPAPKGFGLPFTVHGFRSSFRDWAAEQTDFPRDVAEMALGHTIRDKTEAAYRRGALIEKRRLMIDARARYCCRSPLYPPSLPDST